MGRERPICAVRESPSRNSSSVTDAFRSGDISDPRTKRLGTRFRVRLERILSAYLLTFLFVDVFALFAQPSETLSRRIVGWRKDFGEDPGFSVTVGSIV